MHQRLDLLIFLQQNNIPCFFTEPYYCELDRDVNVGFGIDYSSSSQIKIGEGSSAEAQGLKTGDYIFSINKKNVLVEDGYMITRLLSKSGSNVEIGVVRPKNIDANLCKSISFMIVRSCFNVSIS